MRSFYDACSEAGPELCSFYASSPEVIAQNLDDLYQTIREKPAPIITEKGYGMVDYSLLRRAVFTALYSPFTMFEPLSSALRDLQRGDGMAMYELLQNPWWSHELAKDKGYQQDNLFEASTALHCLDGVPVDDSPSELREFYRNMTKLSSLAELWAVVRIRCS